MYKRQGLVLCLLFSGISFALDVLVAHVVIRPDSGRDEAIERMGIIYSNRASATPRESTPGC